MLVCYLDSKCSIAVSILDQEWEDNPIPETRGRGSPVHSRLSWLPLKDFNLFWAPSRRKAELKNSQ